MKKVLILSVALCAALLANAAATEWKFTSANMYGPSGDKWNGDVEIWAAGGDLSEAKLVTTLKTTNGALSNVAFSSDLFTAETSYDFYYVLSSSQGVLTSTTKPITALGTGAATINFGNQASYTQNASNWAAAPEPTSGLLLLLGVAGLALKRKRA